MNTTSPCTHLRFFLVIRQRSWILCRLEVRESPGTGQVYAR